ncbi:hypothetical protein BJ546DRAFT_793954, partial [Cryomyces antarcticus]
TATQRLQKRRKRSKRATTTWSFARDAYEGERTRCPRGQLLWCCKFCSDYKTLSTSSARAHLKSIHDIHVQEEGGVVKKNTTVELKSLLQRQRDKARLEQALKDQAVLKAALDKDVVHESLIRLVCAHNLPHSVVEWPEFRIFCFTLNPMAGGVLSKSHST